MTTLEQLKAEFAEAEKLLGGFNKPVKQVTGKVGDFVGRVSAYHSQGNRFVSDAVSRFDDYARKAKRRDFKSPEDRESRKNAALASLINVHDRIADDLASLIGHYEDVQAWALNAWDQQKLNTEAHAVDRQWKSLKVMNDHPARALRDQAEKSKNSYKMRAAGEYLLGFGDPEKMSIGRALVSKADQLQGVDTTEADQAMSGAVYTYERMRKRIVEAHESLFLNNVQSSVLADTLNRVRRLSDGVQITSPDGEKSVSVQVTQ